MDGVKIEVTGNIARIVERPARITSGTVGLPVEFSFDSQWDGLSKTAVFRAGRVVKIAENLEAETIVPWEVLERPNVWLCIGVYGVHDDGTVAIPTIWANVCVICEGVNPDGDVSTAPTLPVWQRLCNAVGNLLGLTTNAKGNLVEAINEVHNIALAGGIETDPTFTQEGKAAEAMATGDEFWKVWDQMQTIDLTHVSKEDVIDIAHGGTGSTTVDGALAALGAAATSHNHSASQIASGTLPVARGGTGGATEEAARKSIGAGSNENLLDNWYFADPVNQRGAMQYTAEGFCLDRWSFEQWKPSKQSVQLRNGCVAIVSGAEASTNNTTKLRQTLVDLQRLAGKTVTFSAKLKNVTVNGNPRLTIYYGGSKKDVAITSADTNSIISVTETLPTTLSSMYVAIGNDGNAAGKGNFDIEIESVKLEIGSISTLANDAPPKKSEQLLECQRYYIRWSNTAKQQAFSGGAAGTAVYAAVQLPTAMQGTATPTVTYAELDIYNFVSNGAVATKGCGCNMLGSRNSVVLWVTYDATSACPGQTPASIRIGENGYIALPCEV